MTETLLWSDNPTARDLLGFADIADGVIEALEREKLDPVALGIFGDWGSGKTSILEITEDALDGRDGTIVVFTHPWEYDPRTDAKATLIAEVLSAIEKQARGSAGWTDTLGDAFTALRNRVDMSKAISLVANTAVTLRIPSIADVVSVFSKEGEVSEPTLQGFREQFAETMGQLTDVKRVVVLVDDLDRCLPGTVVATLEAIKLFLSVPKMGFVIAADERLVQHAIATQYEGAARPGEMAREYLEKIVQIPVRVPVLGLADIEAYLALLLLESHLPDDAEGKVDKRLAQLIAHCGERRGQACERIWDDVPKDAVPDEAADDLALARMLAPILARRMGNPRRIKRFLNAYWMRAAIAHRRGAAPEDPAALAKLMVLEELDSRAFGKLLGWLGEDVLSERLRALEDPAENTGEDAELVTWARQEPRLSGTDLGPYLRLAASLRALPAPTSLRSELEALLDRLTSGSPGERKEAQKEAAGHQQEDKVKLARELAGRIVARPAEPTEAAESLGELLKDDPAGEISSAAAAELGEMDPSKVLPVVVIRLAPNDTPSAPICKLLQDWVDSGAMNETSEGAARDALADGDGGG
jgi:hypothetical protein